MRIVVPEFPQSITDSGSRSPSTPRPVTDAVAAVEA